MTLTGKQKRRLRGLAHGLKPIVRVGRGGLTTAVAGEIDRALDHHELIKVRLDGDRDERRDLSRSLETRLGCDTVGAIGAVVVLYRRPVAEDEAKIDV